MNIEYIETFEAIAERENLEEAVEFLKILPKEYKTTFAKAIGKKIKKGSKWSLVEVGQNSFQYKTDKPHKYLEVLSYGGLMTFNYTDVQKYTLTNSICFTPTFDELIEYQTPKWLDKWFNNELSDTWVVWNNYIKIKDYQTKGYIQPLRDEVLASALSYLPSTCYQLNEKRHRIYNDNQFKAILYQYFDWIKSDLHLIFQNEIGFGNYYNLTRNVWFEHLKRLIDEALLDRMTIIYHIFDAFNRPFNRKAASVFRHFLDFLELSNDEKLQLQIRCFEMLSNANPQHVSYALKEIKKIEKLNNFDYQNFIDYTEPILVEDSKGMVKNTLMLLERTAKKNTELHEEIVHLVLLALVNEDEDIQKRVLKILQKFAPQQDEAFSDKLMIYFENIKPSLQAAFSKFLAIDTPISSIGTTEDFQPKKINPLVDAFQIQYIQNWDDWVYHASATYENREASFTDIENLLESFARMYRNGKTNSEQIEPLITRVKDTIEKHWETSHKIVGNIILTVHFTISHSVKELEFIKAFFEKRYEEYKNKRAINLEKILFQRIMLFFEMAVAEHQLPILSPSTHHNCWIHPEILVKRLLAYQEGNISPNPIDFAHAIGKTYYQPSEKAIQQAEHLKGENGKIIRWLFNGNLDSILQEISNQSKPSKQQLQFLSPKKDVVPWFNALRTRFPLADVEALKIFKFGEYPNTAIAQTYNWESTQKRHSYPTSDGKEAYFTSHSIRIKYEIYPHIALRKTPSYEFLYHFISKSSKYYIYNDHLFTRWILQLMPNNTETLFAFANQQIIGSSSDYDDVVSNKFSRGLLQQLIDTNIPLHPMGLFFLASAMTFVDKVSRSLAAEVMIHYLNQEMLDKQSIGINIGRLIKGGYGRIQRIYPCLVQISEVSKYHALAVKEILETMLLQFPIDELPRNTKKLLELLQNINLQYHQTTPVAPFQQQINLWKTKSGLKKLVNHLFK